MNDITVLACILVAVTVLIAWMRHYGHTFAGFDVWWNMQFERLGAWFMRMASGWDDPTARKSEKRGQP